MLVVLGAICAGTVSGQSQPQSGQPPAQSESAKQPERVHVERGVTRGLLIKRVDPEYPEKARRKRIQGTVVLHAVISKDGDIVDLSTVSGDALLVKSAMKAVRQWKYKPYMLNNQAVEVDTQILVNFTLSGN